MNRITVAGGVLHGWLYRISNGKVAGKIGKAPVLVLTTKGRKTDKERTNPLLYVTDGSSYAIVASAGGQDEQPAWYLNLVANPVVTIQIGSKTEGRIARVASAEEKARVWPALIAVYKTYDKYQTKTTREIPVVLLDRP